MFFLNLSRAAARVLKEIKYENLFFTTLYNEKFPVMRITEPFAKQQERKRAKLVSMQLKAIYCTFWLISFILHQRWRRVITHDKTALESLSLRLYFLHNAAHTHSSTLSVCWLGNFQTYTYFPLIIFESRTIWHEASESPPPQHNAAVVDIAKSYILFRSSLDDALLYMCGDDAILWSFVMGPLMSHLISLSLLTSERYYY